MTPQTLKAVGTIDIKVSTSLKRGGEEALLVSLHDLILMFEPVLDAADLDELDWLSGDYPHFGWFAARCLILPKGWVLGRSMRASDANGAIRRTICPTRD